jgi:hypothetical protein
MKKGKQVIFINVLYVCIKYISFQSASNAAQVEEFNIGRKQ